jgi:hypothetical protein
VKKTRNHHLLCPYHAFKTKLPYKYCVTGMPGQSINSTPTSQGTSTVTCCIFKQFPISCIPYLKKLLQISNALILINYTELNNSELIRLPVLCNRISYMHVFVLHHCIVTFTFYLFYCIWLL